MKMDEKKLNKFVEDLAGTETDDLKEAIDWKNPDEMDNPVVLEILKALGDEELDGLEEAIVRENRDGVENPEVLEALKQIIRPAPEINTVEYPDDALLKIEVPNMDRNGYAARFCYSLSQGWLFYEVENSSWGETILSSVRRLFNEALKTKYAREGE